MELCLPPSLSPNQADWTLLDFSGVQQSPLSGAIRSVSRGQRWQAHVVYQNLIADDRHGLSALMAAMRGKANRIWLADPTYKQRGSFPAPELLTNGSFAQGPAGWSASGSGAVSGYNRALALTTGAGTATQAYQSVSLTSGITYALRACLIDGPLTAGLNIGVQLADTGHQYLANGRGLVTVAATAQSSGAANQAVLNMLSGGGLAAGMAVTCTYSSLRRCALAVNPAAATYFTTLPIDMLPASTWGLLRAGDRVEINGEMKTVTFDLNSDSGGSGWLSFEPALRKLVPDNAPIIIGQPMMRGILTVDAMQVTRPGVFSDFDFTFVEG